MDDSVKNLSAIEATVAEDTAGLAVLMALIARLSQRNPGLAKEVSSDASGIVNDTNFGTAHDDLMKKKALERVDFLLKSALTVGAPGSGPAH